MTNYKKDEIYIDCQPVNSEGETLVEKEQTKKETVDIDLNYILNNPILSFFIGVIILFILHKLLCKAINVMYKKTENIRSQGGSIMDD